MEALKSIYIEDIKYLYSIEREYIKEGHAYCKYCHERKDGNVVSFFNRKIITRRLCKCDREKEKQEERKRQLLIKILKKDCFNTETEYSYSFKNYARADNKALLIAKNYVDEYEKMKKDNIGLLFIGNVGSGKTYLSCAIANAVIERYLERVKVRNFSQIMNDLQKSSFDFNKNEYIEKIVDTPLLILDDLGIERDTSYAKEQVYNIINSRYLKKKPTIFTTNLPYKKLQESNDIQVQRIYSRIKEMTIPIKVVGDDFRDRLQKEKINKSRDILLKGGEEIG